MFKSRDKSLSSDNKNMLWHQRYKTYYKNHSVEKITDLLKVKRLFKTKRADVWKLFFYLINIGWNKIKTYPVDVLDDPGLGHPTGHPYLTLVHY